MHCGCVGLHRRVLFEHQATTQCQRRGGQDFPYYKLRVTILLVISGALFGGHTPVHVGPRDPQLMHGRDDQQEHGQVERRVDAGAEPRVRRRAVVVADGAQLRASRAHGVRERPGGQREVWLSRTG